MGQNDTPHKRLKVSPQVAQIVAKGAPRDVQLSAARGALPLSGKELLTVLLFFCGGKDAELRKTAVTTLRQLPTAVVLPVLQDDGVGPHLLELVARVRGSEDELAGAIIVNPQVQDATLLHLARTAPSAVLERLANHQGWLERCPEIIDAILENPQAERTLKFRFGWQEPADDQTQAEVSAEEPTEEELPDTGETTGEADIDEEIDGEIEEEGELSKYQISLTLKVSEKIKMGLTGDKEWRSLLTKDANKLVQAGVMKNPRITDGEVVAIARNKQSSDEMIRLILLNKDWMKLYEIKKALVMHPKTPLPKAIRMVPFLNQKDLKDLARSRNVQTILSTSARKELERKAKRS